MIENMLLNHISGISDLICNPHLSSGFLHQYLNAIIRPFIYKSVYSWPLTTTTTSGKWCIWTLGPLEMLFWKCHASLNEIPSLKARGSQAWIFVTMLTSRSFSAKGWNMFFFATIASSIKILNPQSSNHFRVGNPCGCDANCGSPESRLDLKKRSQ